ncbi:hypothetical protein [Candidatus Manganitrophus noduliformans]|uniref:Tip attachment protein J domain-containing protein n=1 Tax=Candidatus Manganitrophus noduliformans TaxID=2606439 RepID=A0A7X6DQ13_9BACT|nr:hypothetical protein [Candidatus Manganitrophus noduliformans]NKE71251.1 hypothetical protein [Candidatus Manganitrophus noduliformans]
MVFSSRAQRAIDKNLGASSAPLDLTGSIYNPADLAWTLLTTHGGLDSTASTANVDIDYTSWSAYKGICSSLAFRLKAYFRGETIAEALRLIGKLTDSLIYGETDGKIYFNRFIPKETYPTIYTFTEESAHLQAARLYFNKSRIINRANVWYNYDPIGDFWEDKATSDNATSQTDYGLVEKDFNDAAVWHYEYYSAKSLSDRLVYRYFEPAETVVFRTKQGTQALIHQLGDNIRLTWSQLDYSSKVFRIYGISADLLNQQYEIEAEEDNEFGQAYFTLNSSTHGVLGTNKLF